LLAEVPTIVEAGFPSLVIEDWTGFAVKRGTPKGIITRLNAAINKALATPAVRDAFAKLGAEAAGGSSDQYGDLVKQQLAHWNKVVTDANIKVSQ
jgi:tripartite-type tricarboxylate transporter receptor subunit TctC